MTPSQLQFIERCWRFTRLERLKAPKQLLKQAKRLIKEAVQKLEGDEIAHAMMEFPSTVAKLQRIDNQVEAEHPTIAKTNKPHKPSYSPSHLRIIATLKKALSVRRLWRRSCIICGYDIEPGELCRSNGHGYWGHATCVQQFVMPN